VVRYGRGCEHVTGLSWSKLLSEVEYEWFVLIL
jgi:hypothetical protein